MNIEAGPMLHRGGAGWLAEPFALPPRATASSLPAIMARPPAWGRRVPWLPPAIGRGPSRLRRWRAGRGGGLLLLLVALLLAACAPLSPLSVLPPDLQAELAPPRPGEPNAYARRAAGAASEPAPPPTAAASSAAIPAGRGR